MNPSYQIYKLQQEAASLERQARIYDQAAQVRGWATDAATDYLGFAQRDRQLASHKQTEIRRLQGRTAEPQLTPGEATPASHLTSVQQGTTNEREHNMVTEASSFDRDHPEAGRIAQEQAATAERITAARLESIREQDQRAAAIAEAHAAVVAAAGDHGWAR